MIDLNIFALGVFGDYLSVQWLDTRNSVDALMAAFAGAMILLNLYVSII